MKISQSEMKIMRLIWNSTEPLTAAQLMEQLPQEGWKPTTLLTFLSRLEEKGFVTISKRRRQNTYSARVTEQQYKTMETRAFLEQIHGGSTASLLSALCDAQPLTPEEAQELRRWFDQQGGEEK
ncbi:BlaI/MecI/CopY family transcriptional regulator [Angelakisella massiliensis]|uniref:BlaI/MecI/CopY family transcriptional regulator n=1 Tax=Angelakisella massiliensis TaxID=1871018 RepID=UPI0008F897E6|nr:BlaI/MecI/CopY family transcriptional regulator [Angelakisella massiliensis]